MHFYVYLSCEEPNCLINLALSSEVLGLFWPFITLSRSAVIQDLRARTTGSHVVLRARNSGTESGRELFKGFKINKQKVCESNQSPLGR